MLSFLTYYRESVVSHGLVGRAEDQRSRGLGFDSRHRSWVGALGKLLILQCLSSWHRMSVIETMVSLNKQANKYYREKVWREAQCEHQAQWDLCLSRAYLREHILLQVLISNWLRYIYWSKLFLHRKKNLINPQTVPYLCYDGDELNLSLNRKYYYQVQGKLLCSDKKKKSYLCCIHPKRESPSH